MTTPGTDDGPEAPGEVEVLLDRAQTLFDLGRFDQALPLLQRALALEPDWPPTLIGLAETYHSTGESESALEAAERAITLDPDNALAHEIRSNILIVDGRFAEGRAAAREAVRLAPDDFGLLGTFAFALTANGPDLTPTEVDEAEWAARRMRDLEPDGSGAHARLGEVASIRRQWDAMEAHLRRALALDPGWSHVIKMLGSLLICRGRADEGYRLVYEAVRTAPDDDRAAVLLRYWLARLLFPVTLPACVLLDALWLSLWGLGHWPWPLAYGAALLAGAALTALLLWRRPGFLPSLSPRVRRFPADLQDHTRRWWRESAPDPRLAEAAALLPLTLKVLWLAMAPVSYWKPMLGRLHRL